MLEESDRAWDKISSRSYAFHALRDECTHLRVLSLQQVGWAGAPRRGTGLRPQSPVPAPPASLLVCTCLHVRFDWLQVREFYGAYLAPGSTTRRKLSLHVVGRAHATELDAPPAAGVQLIKQLSELDRLPLWPAMLGDAHACN